jgi:LmbE family N-acetylglucosaminyl deacetylase
VWRPPATRTVVVAPHPDDETLGAGGLIATLRRQNVEVSMVAVTDGENAYSNARNHGPIRRREQEDALQILGLDKSHIIRFGLPDREVSQHEDTLVDLLLPFAADDVHLVAPWTGDFHPDHEACGRAAEEVARQSGAHLSFYFFWTWHRGTPDLLAGLPLKLFSLTSTAIAKKAEAVRCHRSQLSHPSGEPILPEYLLGPTRWPFEVFEGE